MRELRSHLGRHQPTRFDAEAEKRAGWRQHGILVVAEEDPRLTWPEREIVRHYILGIWGCFLCGGQRVLCRLLVAEEIRKTMG